MYAFYYNGRPDGIGNRIEQLLYLETYCEKNNIQCIYIWNNSKYRNYPIYIQFKHITIKEKLDKNECNVPQYTDIKIFGLKYNINNHTFLFALDVEDYDTAIHIRGGDRIQQTPTHFDFSTLSELELCIIKTATYINNNESIKKCIIVCEEKIFISKLKNLLKKNIYVLPTNTKYHDWQDFYYLTRATKNIIMCCKFSSFSICASILSNLNLITFFDDSESNLSRYNAKIIKI